MTLDLDAVRAMMEGVTERIQEAADAVQAMGSYSGEDFARKMVAQTAIASARELVPALAAEVEAARATIAELQALVDACAPYLKEGETPAERIEREIKDAIMLMGMLANDRKERDAGRATIAGLEARVEAMTKAASLTVRADDLREVYHALPNDKNRIGDKRSRKGHARDAWLRAFRKASANARAALRAASEKE